MTANIDKLRLENDLFYRFEYLAKFFDFNSQDIQILNQIYIYIQSRIPILVDTIYRKLFTFDITKQYFFFRHSDFSQAMPDKEKLHFSFHCEQLEYRKNMLSNYLKRIFTEEQWNDGFIQYLSNVGQIHTNRIGSKMIHVDYIHLNALLGYIEQNLIDLVYKLTDINDQMKSSAILAINKFFWIQNEFFRMHF